MEKGKTLPIIAVTAHALDDVKSRCDQVGMTDAIQKPLTPEDTLTFFNTYLYDKGYLINESVVPKKKEVHKLKGALSLVEAPELSEAVVQFNNGLKVGQRGNIPALLAATVKAADVFKQHIARRVIPKNPE